MSELKPGDRPIRFKGIIRAANRGESWAKSILKGGFVGLLHHYFYKVDFKEIINNTSLIDKIGKSDFSWDYLAHIQIPLSKRKRRIYRNGK